MAQPVGGGSKKILYALKTARRIGLRNSAKALGARNTCKACGLGMGGQLGGMTNELGEFPSVCNKSVQAQSTDIQPPIPTELFEHGLAALRELTPRELEHLGRVGEPLHKPADSESFVPVSWEFALDRTVERLAGCEPDRSFFYCSGRSSNEAGFLLQLLARLYGTNNVNNCSYYCHQATSEGLRSTIGKGTATVELADLGHCDTVFLIGANPASNHPRLIHQLMACRDRGGDVVVINPARETGLVRFAVPKSPSSLLAGGTEIASLYLQPNIGGDIALFKGLAKALLARGAENSSYINAHCDRWEAFRDDLETLSWDALLTESGVSRSAIEQAADVYARSKRTVFAWGMGMTHHAHGVQNVEYIANLALMRGMVGRVGAGLLPLRGHSNVQGIGTIGVKPVLPAQVFDRLQEALGVELPTSPGVNTLAGLEAAHRGEIDCAVLVGGNLFGATPDTEFADEALSRIGFKLYLTTTLNQSHIHGVTGSESIVLPVAARDEEPQPTTQESMFNFVRLSDGGIDRLEHARSEVAILSQLGARLLKDRRLDFGQFENHDTVRETIARTVPGLEALKDISVARREFHVKGRILHRPEFASANGRASFRVHPLPHTRKSEYPFLLASVRSEGQFNSIIYEDSDSYRFDAPRDSLLMCPEDIARLNLSPGDRVDVSSETGTLRSVELRAYDLPPGNVLAYYPEANVLVGRAVDPRSFTPAFKSVPVSVVAAA
ncbi:MAG: FdhF/YdeP family oxidoreductase [Pseudomonadota bacterium]